MTVTSLVSQITAPGNSVAISFSFAPMVIDAPGNLVVERIDGAGVATLLVRNVDYIVPIPLESFPATGTITYPMSGTPLPTGESLRMTRATPMRQDTDLANQGVYDPELIEQTFDYSRRIDQELGRRVDYLESAVDGMDTIFVSGGTSADAVSQDTAGHLYLTGATAQDAFDQADVLFGSTDAELDTKADKTITISTAAPLTGGGTLSSNPTAIGMATVAGAGDYDLLGGAVDAYGRVVPRTGVLPDQGGFTAGAFTSANVTVDQKGVITAITDGANSAEWFNVKDYGAVGDGVTNDAAAFTAALAAMPSKGGVLYMPKGQYRVNSTITLPDKHLTLWGDGTRASEVSFYGTGGLFVGSFTLAGRHLHAYGIAFTAYAANCGAAISGTWPTALGAIQARNTIIKDCEFRNGGTGLYWTEAVYVFNPKDGIIDNCYATGDFTGAGGYRSGSAGFVYDTDYQGTNFTFVNCYVLFNEFGIRVKGTVTGIPEGIFVNDCTLLANRYGVYAQSDSGSLTHIYVRGGHIAAFYIGVFMEAVLFAEVRDVLFLQRGDGEATQLYTWLSNCQNPQIVNNEFYVNDATITVTGLRLAGASTENVRVLDNMFNGEIPSTPMNIGIEVQAGVVETNDVYARGNKFVNVTTGLSDGSTNGVAIRRPRGCARYNSGGPTALTSGGVIAWNTQLHDTDNFRSGGTGRLTIPAALNGAYVRLGFNIAYTGVETEKSFHIQKNGGAATAGFPCGVKVPANGTAAQYVSAVTGWVKVATGDYFEVIPTFTVATNMANHSSFWIEAYE